MGAQLSRVGADCQHLTVPSRRHHHMHCTMAEPCGIPLQRRALWHPLSLWRDPSPCQTQSHVPPLLWSTPWR